MQCLICNCDIPNRQKLAHHLNVDHHTNMEEYKIKYKPDKNDKLLECPICGRYNMKQLTQHLTGTHKISKEEFLSLYPGTKLWIDEISERCSKAQSIGIQTFRNNLKQDSHYYDEMFARRVANRNTEEISNKIRQTRISRETNILMSERVLELWKDEDYRKLQSEKAKKQHENGLTEIIVKNSGRKRYVLTLDNVTYSMRSTWETRFATYLHEHNIEFQYEPFAIKYTYEGLEKVYYPDFYIVKNNLVIEVKPLNLCQDGRVIAKKQATESLGYKFMFITENELNNLDSVQFE